MTKKQVGTQSPASLNKRPLAGIAWVGFLALFCVLSFHPLAQGYLPTTDSLLLFNSTVTPTQSSSSLSTPSLNSLNFRNHTKDHHYKHNICIAVMGHTLGDITSAPAREMLAVMRTYASGAYNRSTYFMLDSLGNDSDGTAAQLCRAGGFPEGQCVYMGDLGCRYALMKKNCLALKAVKAYDSLRDAVLSDCRYFMRVDSDEYVYLPSLERWLADFPSIDEGPFVFGQVRGKKYGGRFGVSFPGGSSLFNRPMIEKFFGNYEWRAAMRSLRMANLNPTEDDAFNGYVLGYCDPGEEVRYKLCGGDVIQGGPDAASNNLANWRKRRDRHCVWKIHKIGIDDYDEVHSYYQMHALEYNASTVLPTVCRNRVYDRIGSMPTGVEDRACNNTRVAVDCGEFIDSDPPSILNASCVV